MNKIKELIKKHSTATIIIGTLIWFTVGTVYGVMAIIGVTLIVLGVRAKIKPKEKLKEKPKKKSIAETVTHEQNEPLPKENNGHIMRFKVAGVTFKDGRKTRQATLRRFKWGDEEIEEVTYEKYEYEGEDAVYVKVNDKIVGNIPKELVKEFLEYRENCESMNTSINVYGGNKLDDGTRSNYGCEISVHFEL